MEGKDLVPNQEPEARLIEVGDGFRVDRKELEKRTDSELIKIANEELFPYKLYLQQSAKSFGLPFLAILSGFAAMYSSEKVTAFSGFIVFVCFVVMIFSTRENHDFFIPSVLKMCRAKKLFRQITEELRAEVLSGKTDITTLKTIFHDRRLKKLELIRKMEQERDDAVRRMEKEKRDLIQYAKENDV